jgi:NAD(P)-dependent dehydrogenase (short-subunit alcohol dehydrogenase family)
VEGFSDALVSEAGPLGIKTTCIEPGPFRTDWAGRSLHQNPVKIADYEATVGARLKQTSGYSGQQPGDPVRAAEIMIEVAAMDDPPRHLVLGEFGYNAVIERMQKRLDEIKAWKETSLRADFPKA